MVTKLQCQRFTPRHSLTPTKNLITPISLKNNQL
jgi:hypothetical protein